MGVNKKRTVIQLEINLMLKTTTPLTYMQQINEEQQIEHEISKKFGYTFHNDSIILNTSSQLHQTNTSNTILNPNLQPLQVKDFDVEPSSRFQRFLKQLEDEQYFKILKARQSKATYKQVEVSQFIQKHIKDYNYLVDHKHFKEKKAANSFQFEQKNSIQLIVEEINKETQQLLKAQNLTQQFNLNKKINELYKSYRDKMFNDKNEKKNRSSRNSLQAGKTFKKNNNAVSSLRKNSKNYTYFKLNLEQQAKNSQKLFKQSIDLDDPMKERERLRKSKRLDISLKQTQDKKKYFQSEVKQKIKNFQFIKTQELRRKQLKNSKKQIKLNLQNNDNKSQNAVKVDRYLQKALDGDSQKIFYQSSKTEKVRDNKQQQQFVLSAYLSKKNRKFKKNGNNLIIKYNSLEQAKDMIQGRATNLQTRSNTKCTSRSKTPAITTRRAELTRRNLSYRNSQIVKDKKQLENNELYLNIIQSQEDPEHQKRMYKNQKVNMFLRKRS